MGNPKTDRTEYKDYLATQRAEALMQAARRYTVAKQAEQTIEQHNLDRLVNAGVIVRYEGNDNGTKELSQGYNGSTFCEITKERGKRGNLQEIIKG